MSKILPNKNPVFHKNPLFFFLVVHFYYENDFEICWKRISISMWNYLKDYLQYFAKSIQRITHIWFKRIEILFIFGEKHFYVDEYIFNVIFQFDDDWNNILKYFSIHFIIYNNNKKKKWIYLKTKKKVNKIKQERLWDFSIFPFPVKPFFAFCWIFLEKFI